MSMTNPHRWGTPEWLVQALREDAQNQTWQWYLESLHGGGEETNHSPLTALFVLLGIGSVALTISNGIGSHWPVPLMIAGWFIAFIAPAVAVTLVFALIQRSVVLGVLVIIPIAVVIWQFVRPGVSGSSTGSTTAQVLPSDADATHSGEVLSGLGAVPKWFGDLAHGASVNALPLVAAGGVWLGRFPEWLVASPLGGLAGWAVGVLLPAGWATGFSAAASHWPWPGWPALIAIAAAIVGALYLVQRYVLLRIVLILAFAGDVVLHGQWSGQ